MTIRKSKAEAILIFQADVSAGIDRKQRAYATLWGCSQSTAHAWIRSAKTADQTADHSRSEGRSRSRSEPITADQGADQLAVIADRLDQILAVLLRATSELLALKEKSTPAREDPPNPPLPITQPIRADQADQPIADHAADQADHRSADQPIFALVSVPSKPVSLKDRVIAVWPAIRAAFLEYGRRFDEVPGADRIKIIGKRISERTDDGDMVLAVHGYVQQKGGLERDGDFDPRKHFTTATIFKAEGFSDRVDSGREPRKPIPARASSSKDRVKSGVYKWDN